ncbi:hypothetical protein Sjap_002608 [Stephania japonica]|uniref:Uncharacterized protein n=1 Tax=Stephania japonica TaxID=461633 RepID=A0AAP0KM82_9MAGN
MVSVERILLGEAAVFCLWKTWCTVEKSSRWLVGRSGAPEAGEVDDVSLEIHREAERDLSRERRERVSEFVVVGPDTCRARGRELAALCARHIEQLLVRKKGTDRVGPTHNSFLFNPSIVLRADPEALLDGFCSLCVLSVDMYCSACFVSSDLLTLRASRLVLWLLNCTHQLYDGQFSLFFCDFGISTLHTNHSDLRHGPTWVSPNCLEINVRALNDVNSKNISK